MQPIKVGSRTKTNPNQHTDFSLRLTKINYACISELYIRNYCNHILHIWTLNQQDHQGERNIRSNGGL